MSEWSGFFNSYNDDRMYTAGQFAEYFAAFVGNGVFWGGSHLKVNAVGGNMDVSVSEGKGWINGYYYINRDAPKTLTLIPPDLFLPRIDRVVLRLDLSQNTRFVQAVIKQGTANDNPVAPALQRDNAAWELGLADIRVNVGVKEVLQSNIADLRLNANMCGIVAAVVEQPDLTMLYNQYQNYLHLKTAEWDAGQADYFNAANTWLAAYQDELTERRGVFIRQFEEYLDTKMSEWETTRNRQQQEYETQRDTVAGWYASVKNDIAKLQLFDFDNLAALTDAKRMTTFMGGSVQETITAVYDNEIIAERVTEFDSGGVTETVTLYKSDDESVMRQSIKRTIFNPDGSVTETITGGGAR